MLLRHQPPSEPKPNLAGLRLAPEQLWPWVRGRNMGNQGVSLVLWMDEKLPVGEPPRKRKNYCVWTKSVRTTLKSREKPWFVGMYVGESNHSVGFLRRCRIWGLCPKSKNGVRQLLFGFQKVRGLLVIPRSPSNWCPFSPTFWVGRVRTY